MRGRTHIWILPSSRDTPRLGGGIGMHALSRRHHVDPGAASPRRTLGAVDTVGYAGNSLFHTDAYGPTLPGDT